MERTGRGKMETGNDHNGLLKSLAEAVQEHLELPLDEAKVREIAAEEVSKARMPRPLAITVNDRPTAILPEWTHCQFEGVAAAVRHTQAEA